MSKLRFRISMSLDGFVAGPSQSVGAFFSLRLSVAGK